MIYIFDFDGVIKDSVDIKGIAFRELYQDDESVADKVYRDHLKNGGVPRLIKFHKWEQKYFGRKLSSEREKFLLESYEAIVVNRVIDSPYIEGFINFYNNIKDDLKFVCTASPEDEAKLIIDRLGLDFNDVFGFPKSKEEIIEGIKKTVGSHHEFLYFGDSDKDLKACIACDIPFVPINYSGRLLKTKKTTFKEISG